MSEPGKALEKPRGKGGRPRWQPPPLERVEAMAQRGLSKKQIAAALGIGESTLQRHQKWDAAFSAAIERGKAAGIVALANAGYDLAIVGKDGPMIRFLLSTVGGFKSTDRLELTGEDGGPVQVEGNVRHTVDILARIAHYDLVLATDGARTHAREEFGEAVEKPAIEAPKEGA